MGNTDESDLVRLRPDQPFFETLYTASSLVIVGTREPNGSVDLAPKHMAVPLGWSDYFGFVCTPTHATYRNVELTGEFTVSYPRPEHVLEASLAAGPREPDDSKPSLRGIDTVAADVVDAPAVADAYAVLECELDRIVDGFGENGLITGEIVAAHVASDAYSDDDVEPEVLLERAPVLTYLYPDRIATVSETTAFPFPVGFRR